MKGDSGWLVEKEPREGIGGGNNSHVTKSHHADRLPDTQSNTRRHTAVETTDTVVVVDVFESLADGEVLGPVGVLGLALHLNTDDLNGLVPGGQTTTKTRCEDLLPGRQLLAVLLVGHLADGSLRQAGETEPGAPVGSLANGNGIDTAVDTTDALPAVNVREGREGARGLDTLRGHLVLGDLNRLHAGTEAHGRVGLGDTTDHTTGDTAEEVVGADPAGLVFGFGGDEQEDGALGGGLNPGPRNESLIV